MKNLIITIVCLLVLCTTCQAQSLFDTSGIQDTKVQDSASIFLAADPIVEKQKEYFTAVLAEDFLTSEPEKVVQAPLQAPEPVQAPKSHAVQKTYGTYHETYYETARRGAFLGGRLGLGTRVAGLLGFGRRQARREARGGGVFLFRRGSC